MKDTEGKIVAIVEKLIKDHLTVLAEEQMRTLPQQVAWLIEDAWNKKKATQKRKETRTKIEVDLKSLIERIENLEEKS